MSMEASDSRQQHLEASYDNLQESMGSLLLKSNLPEEFQSSVPQEILGLPYKLSTAANEQLLQRKYGITELHWASLIGSTDYATYLLNRGVNVHSKASARGRSEIEGVTPLFLAARSGHMLLVVLLLEHGAEQDILKRGRKGNTALHAAALSGKDGVVKLLMNSLPKKYRGAPADHENPVDVKGCEERTPLHYAAGGGHEHVVRTLMQEWGASRSARDANGATPFHFAAGWGNNIPALKMLMGQHVDEATDTKGRTALHYAASKGQLRTVQWLLDHGASINAPDSLNGDTPLHLAARHSEVIDALANRGADIWLKNRNGDLAIALSHAHKNAMAVKAHLKAIQRLPGDVVDPLAKHGNNGATLLHYFSAYGTTEDVDWILGLSAFHEDTIRKINTVDYAGQTAVHWVAAEGNADVLRVLVERKANLHVIDKKGRSVLCLAICHSKDMKFVNAFLGLPLVRFQVQKWVTHEEAARWMKEYYSVHHNQVNTKILSRQAHSTIENALDELPPIFLALHAQRKDIASFMQKHIKETAQDAVNKTGENTGRTALHWAAIWGEEDIISKLMSTQLFAKELKANVEDKHEKTALQYAIEMNRWAIERKLMQRADVRAHLEGLYRDRQVYANASNAILVAAALIASVTFAGWLQPPLNYTTYYDLPPLASPPAPEPAIFPVYAAVQQHVGVRVFWTFNSLSFIFAIATVLAGLVGLVPIPGHHIMKRVVHLRRTLWVASAMLSFSILFVLGAFAAAGFTVLPPMLKYQANMMSTVIVGGVVCIFLLWVWYLRPLLAIWFRQRVRSPFPTPPPPAPTPPHPFFPSCPWDREY